MEPKDGGPAFPTSMTWSPGNGDALPPTDGMTPRDWFAGQAMLSVVGLVGIPEDGPDDLWDGSIATRCFALADAMLAERAK